MIEDYDKRLAAMDEEFKSWWEKDDDPEKSLFANVSREVAYAIWHSAYRVGGNQPWVSMNISQAKVLQEALCGACRNKAIEEVAAHIEKMTAFGESSFAQQTRNSFANYIRRLKEIHA